MTGKQKQGQTITVTLKKGVAGCTERQRACIRGLGLKKIHSTRKLANTPAVRGIIKKVIHMLEVKEAG